MKRSHKLLSLILTICIAMSMLTGFAPANAVVDSTAIGNEVFELPDIVDSVEAKENDYIGRVEAEEKDLYTFVFANGDGTNTMRIYSHPVKYVADDGSIRDISLDIEAKRGGGFVTADHEIVTTFENELTDGITLEYNDIEIMLVPTLGLGTMPTAELSTDGKVVTYEMNDITSFVYELTYAGFKEDIVVEEYTGQTEYAFTLFTNGLTLCEEYGSYYLADAEGNVEATIGDIIVFTADERNNTMGSMTYETVRANQEYVLTIHLDAEYLADEDTVYPIRIDPTIEINYDNNGTGAIEDVTINQNATFSGTSGSLYVGRHPAGSLSRVLMRFPNLSLSGISANQITAATVEIRDLMCQGDEDITVECRIYNNASPAWSEAGTTTWSSVGTSYAGTLLDSHVISYGQGNVGNHRYSFNILTAAKAWANGTQSPAKGLVFKANSTFENQTGDAIKTWYKTFAAYNRSGNRPSFSLTYSSGITRSLYYSKYDPTKFNNSGSAPAVGSYTDLIQYRMNCYGYAFCYLLNGNATVTASGGYKQQPGEFASTSNKANTVNNIVVGNPTASMANVVSNMRLDASRLGFTLTEYSTSSSTVAQYGDSSRLIAVVTGVSDYHFYMQHNDGTWSHKPGSKAIINTSLTSKILLTNSNIKTLANEGAYANGALKFFVITKTAVVDYPHGTRCCLNWPCSHTQSALYRKEVAGDYLQTSKTKNTGNTVARIDFAQDHDVYCFTPSTTKTYTITTTCSSGANLDCILYDDAGVQIGSSTPSGQVSITITLVAGKKYYFDIYNYSKTVTDYTFSIS